MFQEHDGPMVAFNIETNGPDNELFLEKSLGNYTRVGKGEKLTDDIYKIQAEQLIRELNQKNSPDDYVIVAKNGQNIDLTQIDLTNIKGIIDQAFVAMTEERKKFKGTKEQIKEELRKTQEYKNWSNVTNVNKYLQLQELNKKLNSKPFPDQISKIEESIHPTENNPEIQPPDLSAQFPNIWQRLEGMNEENRSLGMTAMGSDLAKAVEGELKKIKDTYEQWHFVDELMGQFVDKLNAQLKKVFPQYTVSELFGWANYENYPTYPLSSLRSKILQRLLWEQSGLDQSKYLDDDGNVNAEYQFTQEDQLTNGMEYWRMEDFVLGMPFRPAQYIIAGPVKFKIEIDEQGTVGATVTECGLNKHKRLQSLNPPHGLGEKCVFIDKTNLHEPKNRINVYSDVGRLIDKKHIIKI